MTLYEIVRKNLADAMQGRSQADCARTIGRSRGWFYELLRGRRGGSRRHDITLTTLGELAQAVGVPPWMLLLPLFADDHQTLIDAGRRQAHWIQHAMTHVREIARQTGERGILLGAISADGHAWELAAALGAICGASPSPLIVWDRSVEGHPASGTACPYHENRTVCPYMTDDSEGRLSPSHQSGSPDPSG